ncbi:hypothetical protein FSP39_004489 [Pinctada imbricata]|uniref:CCZ1/INTU/HSP4 first Longin domain-containing protein n=1 Tax=Pinctada imbricata TaxID=66713 RepID=A0AA88XEF7_PINIB|nr:hypothetical protein FSP39_004489 [Pinctada imbricata]
MDNQCTSHLDKCPLFFLYLQQNNYLYFIFFRKNGVGVFFIYDHLMLQKEEDDLKDAILYFYPPFVSEDDQCAVCGQLMGMSEFLYTTISKSAPAVFKLQYEKYCLKRIGNYTLGLEGNLDNSDVQLERQLMFLYKAFIMYCGSIGNIRQQYPGDGGGFVRELRGIWDILYPSGSWHDSYLTQAFQTLPTVHIPKGKGEIFLQASNILQSSQRRPGVLLGAIVFKNRVLSTQISPEMTRKLILMTPQLPCLNVPTDYELPVGVRLVTIYTTQEEYNSVVQHRTSTHKHNQNSKFVWTVQGDINPSCRNNSLPSQHTRGSSRTDFSLKKEMEVIPEKDDNITENIVRKNDSTDGMLGNKNRLNHKIGQIWKPADHQTQITQMFESHVSDSSDYKSAVDTDQNKNATEESISDLESDRNGKNGKPSNGFVCTGNKKEFLEKGEIFNKSITSSDDDKVYLNSIRKDGNVEIIAEFTRQITDSVEEQKPEIVVTDSSLQIEETKIVLQDNKFSDDSKSQLSVTSRPNTTMSSSVSDIETTEPETSDAESISQSTKSVNNSHSSSGIRPTKEKLSFDDGENNEVSCEESMDESVSDNSSSKVDNHSVRAADSLNSSLQSSKHSSSLGSSTVSNSTTVSSHTVNEEDWVPADDNLHTMTLYVQGHSDISLLLLMEDHSTKNQRTVPCLWKGALPLLADLDFQVKECLENENSNMHIGRENHLIHDSFFQSLQGSVSQPITGEMDEFQKLAGSMHSDFIHNEQLTDIMFRTVTSSCYGQRTEIDERYHATQNQQKNNLLPLLQSEMSISMEK